MHPYSSQTPYSYRPYWGPLPNDPMIGVSQNNIRSGWESTSYGGYNQNQFNYYAPRPHHGGVFNNGGGRYLPLQTYGPTNSVVAPSQQPQYLPHPTSGPASPVVAPSQSHQPKYLPHQTSGQTNSVVAPSQQPQYMPRPTSGPANPVVAPSQSQQPQYLPLQTSGPSNSVVAPTQQLQYLPHPTSGPASPVVAPSQSQQPKYLPHQTSGLTNSVVAPSQQPQYLPHPTSGPASPVVAPSQSQQPKYLPHQTSGPASPVVAPSQQAKYLPHLTSGPAGPVVAPSQSQQPKYWPHQTSRPASPVVAPSQQPKYLPHQTSGPASPVVAPSQLQQPKFLPHQTSGPASPVVAPSQQPKYLPHQTSRPTSPVVAPSQQPSSMTFCKICEVHVGGPRAMLTHNRGRKHRRMLSLLEESQRHKEISPEIQNSTGETHDQPQSIPLDLHAPACSSIKTQTTDLSSGSAAITVPPTQGPVVSNAIEPSSAAGSGCKSQIQHVLDSQSETQVSTASHYKIQSPTVETNVQNGTSQNKTRSGAESISYSGCSQSQFNNHDVIPHKGSGFNDSSGRCLASQTSGPTIPVVAPSRQPPEAFCKIVQVKLGCPENMLIHILGKKHKRMRKRHKKSRKQKTIKRPERWVISNSERTSTYQCKTIQKSEKTGCLAEKVNSEVQAEEAEGESRDDSVEEGHGFKRKISGSAGGKYLKTNEGIRRLVEPSKPDLNAQSNYVEPLVPLPEVTPSPEKPFEGSSLKSKFPDVLDSQSQIQVSNGMAHDKIQNSTGETNDQPQSISVKSHTHEGSSTNTQTKDVSSDSATVSLSPPQGPMACKVSGPPVAVGSDFKSRIQHALHTESDPQLSEAMERYESHSPIDEANVQLPSSVLVKFQDSAGDGTDTETTDGSSKAEQKMDVLAPELEPQIQHVLHADSVEPQSSEAMTRYESQCRTDEANVSVLVEFQSPAGDSTDIETADGSSKAEQKMSVLAPELEPQSSEAMTHNESQCPTDEANVQLPSSVLVEFQAPAGDSNDTETADGSSKAEQMMDVLAPELEPQSSEAMTHNESQCPTDEANVQLPSSVLVEFQAPAGDDTDTETADGSSKAEQKGDVLASDLGIAQLSQVTICLTCGDEGFPEAIVFCSKCQVYALHRYCMDGDGPVIPIGDVTWFCDDCNEEVADTPHYQSTCLPSGTSYSLHLAENAMQARTEITNCIKQVEEHMQLQQNITEFDGHPDAQPIVDPIWRGSICLQNESTDIVNGVLAHLSSLACPRVMEETRLFPEVLCVDLLQRSQVWPKSFMKCEPSDENIALYFFPENERDAFDMLVDEVISLDLAIRVVIVNAELLVFPSTVLPIKYQKFQAKYYLWGVFRAIQTPLETYHGVSDKHLTRPE